MKISNKLKEIIIKVIDSEWSDCNFIDLYYVLGLEGIDFAKIPEDLLSEFIESNNIILQEETLFSYFRTNIGIRLLKIKSIVDLLSVELFNVQGYTYGGDIVSCYEYPRRDSINIGTYVVLSDLYKIRISISLEDIEFNSIDIKISENLTSKVICRIPNLNIKNTDVVKEVSKILFAPSNEFLRTNLLEWKSKYLDFDCKLEFKCSNVAILSLLNIGKEYSIVYLNSNCENPELIIIPRNIRDLNETDQEYYIMFDKYVQVPKEKRDLSNYLSIHIARWTIELLMGEIISEILKEYSQTNYLYSIDILQDKSAEISNECVIVFLPNYEIGEYLQELTPVRIIISFDESNYNIKIENKEFQVPPDKFEFKKLIWGQLTNYLINKNHG